MFSVLSWMLRSVWGSLGSAFGLFLGGVAVYWIWRVLWALGFGYLSFSAVHFGISFFLDKVYAGLDGFGTLSIGSTHLSDVAARSIIGGVVGIADSMQLDVYVALLLSAYAVVMTLNWLPRLGVVRRGAGVRA